jgi:hypothetical protein
MLDKPKIRAFSEFVRRYGEEKLMECLAENERNGLIYHHPGTITGDYDESSETETIIHMILTGQKKADRHDRFFVRNQPIRHRSFDIT